MPVVTAKGAKPAKASAAKSAVKKAAAKKVVTRKPAAKASVKKSGTKSVTKLRVESGVTAKGGKPAVSAKGAKPVVPVVQRARPVAQPRAATIPIAPERARASEKPTAQTNVQQPTKAHAPVAEVAAADPFDVQPDATFDPTPDTNVPMRGQTSFQHNVQSERVAAQKGQRARMNNRRKI
jgi:hypothetical protein